MIDIVDQKIELWIKEAVGDVEVSFSAPDAVSTGRGISCYLLDMVDDPPMRGTERTPNQILLHYLITTWADTVEEAHRLLGNLAFAAIDHQEYEALLDKVDASIWSAFGIKPLPSFVLAAPLRQDRFDPAVQRVREPLSIHTSPLAEMHGIVNGPNGELYTGAKVLIPGLDRSTTTDRRGAFHFSALPVDPPINQVVVRFKGEEKVASVVGTGTAEEPVEITIAFFEE